MFLSSRVSAAGLTGLLAAAFVLAGPGVGMTAASDGTPGYALSRLDDGSPAGWLPCRTVTWGLAADGGGDGASSDVHHAVQLTAEVTGLRFVYVGESPGVPQRSWLAPGGWPVGAPDLVVAWAVPAGGGGRHGSAGDPAVSDLLTGAGEAAVGGWSATYGQGEVARGHITHGYVVLDALADEQFAPSFQHADFDVLGARRPLRGRLLLHELGHALGLAHVDDDRQVMHPEIGSREARWGSGDRSGLDVLSGAAACRTATRPSAAPGEQPRG